MTAALQKEFNTLAQIVTPLQSTGLMTWPKIESAVQTLARVRDAFQQDAAPSLKFLENILLDTSYQTYYEKPIAAMLLATLPFTEAAPLLLKAALSPNVATAQLGRNGLMNLPRSQANFDLIRQAINENADERAALLIDALNYQNVPDWYTLTADWIKNHPDADVRRAMVNALVTVGGDKKDYHDTLNVALDDKDVPVRIKAAYGLILAGEKQFLPILVEATRHKKVSIRETAIQQLATISLPEVEPPVLLGLEDSAQKVKMAAILSAGYIGTRESLKSICPILKVNKDALINQTAFTLQYLVGPTLKYDWRGPKLTLYSLESVQEHCQELYQQWQPHRRYFQGELLTVAHLINQLINAQHALFTFWILVSMTGQRFGFRPYLNTIANWQSIQKWHTWLKDNQDHFLPGHWYYQNKLQN